MNARVAPLVAVAVYIVSTLPVLTSAASADPSPTGRTPKLMWSSERQATWNRMKTDYENGADSLGAKWYKLVKDNAECGCRYGDTGLWATFMYQWTGERRYVTLAWAKVSEFIAMPPSRTGGNYIRENGIEFVILLDWLWPGLTQTQRSQFQNAIGVMLERELTGNPFIQGYRLDDSDQVVGTYFAVALFQLTHPEDARAKSTFGHPQTGGLDATSLERTSARNEIRRYVERLAAGGEWIESGAYNLGTVNLLLLGAEGVRTATGVDHFPELTRWTPLWAKRQIAFWTPDLAQAYQWGDEEHPREQQLFRWVNASGLAAGLLEGTAAGAQLQGHLLDLVAKYGPTGIGSAEPVVTGRLFFTFNPYAQTREWRTDRTFHASGAGLLLHRSGFEPGDSLFAVHLAPRPDKGAVDHSVRYMNDVELWRRGEWVVTHPRGYAGAPNTGLGTNAVLMYGFGDMRGFKELLGVAWGDTFAYQVGTTGGSAVPNPYYDPPPVFVHEWTRSVLCLPGSTDAIVIYDRAHVTDVQRRDRFYLPDQQLISRAPAPKQWLLHMPVRPTIADSTIRWSTPGGQSVQWSALLPAGSTKTVNNELALRTGGEIVWRDYIKPEELKFHVSVSPAVKRDWDTFLNVIQAGTPGSVNLLRSNDGVEGVQLSREGSADVVALFNAQPSSRLNDAANDPSHDQALRTARLRTAGYQVSWTANTDTTDIYLADLDPAKAWDVEIDGRRVRRVAPTATAALPRIVATGGGPHILKVGIAGDASLASVPEPPPQPRGLRVIK